MKRGGAAIFAVLLIGTARLAHGQGTLMVNFEVPADASAQVGGPFYLNARVENSSNATVRVNMGHHGKWNYEFSLVNPDGTTTALSPYRQIGPGPKGTVTVEPNQVRTRRVLFNEWYSFTNPGEYILKISLTVLLSSSANVSWQKQFFEDLRINVAPRDPERLRETCAKLADAALAATEDDAAADASLALSYVLDPVAVPFLARILKDGPTLAQANAVRGLARVGNGDAQQALRSNLSTADPQLKAQIESALSQFRPGS